MYIRRLQRFYPTFCPPCLFISLIYYQVSGQRKKFRRLDVFALQRSLATLIACKNEFSSIRLHGFLSFVAIFEINLEYFLWGGKPHSLMLLK